MLQNLVKQAVMRVLSEKEVPFNVSKDFIQAADSVENFKSNIDDALGVKGKQEGIKIVWFVPLGNILSDIGVEVVLHVEQDTFSFYTQTTNV